MTPKGKLKGTLNSLCGVFEHILTVEPTSSVHVISLVSTPALHKEYMMKLRS